MFREGMLSMPSSSDLLFRIAKHTATKKKTGIQLSVPAHDMHARDGASPAQT